jgi:hypothetical protein
MMRATVDVQWNSFVSIAKPCASRVRTTWIVRTRDAQGLDCPSSNYRRAIGSATRVPTNTCAVAVAGWPALS